MNRVKHLIHQLESCRDASISSNTCVGSDEKSEFQYTVDGFADQMLSKEQRQFYEDNGYIVIRNHLNEEDVKVLNNRFDNLSKNPKLGSPNMILMRDISLLSKDKNAKKEKEKEKVITKLQYWALDKVFYKDYLRKDKIIKYLQCFVGSNIASIHHMYINKPSDPGTLTSRHPLHQDYSFFPFTNPGKIYSNFKLQRVVI